MVNMKSRKVGGGNKKASKFSRNDSENNLVLAEGSSEIDISDSIYHTVQVHS